jgi:hypothetical protein
MKNPNRLVQILLPTFQRDGTAVPKSVFDHVAHELTEKFGGVTSYLRAPAEGRWQSGTGTEHDQIVVVEVMTEEIDTAYWSTLRKRLERELAQDRIIIRCHTVQLL